MKKKVFIIALAVCLAVLSIAGSSIAYFTDTAEYTNVFTAGNVDITLTEAVAAKNATTGNIEIADASNRIDYNADTVYNPLFPKQVIAKDPVIKNVGSESAYVGAVITITNGNGTIDEVLSTAATAGKITCVTDFIKGLPATGVTVTTVTDGENGPVIGFKIYVVYDAPLAKDNSVSVFTGMEIPKLWDNAEMAYVNGLQVKVEAYAVQTAGMTNGALAALQAAFDAFDTLS